MGTRARNAVLVSWVPPAMSRIVTTLKGFSGEEPQTVNYTLRSAKRYLQQASGLYEKHELFW